MPNNDRFDRNSVTTRSPGNVSGLCSTTTSSSQIYSVLNNIAGHEAIFSVTESNGFRELQHLSLHLRKGNDVAVKEYMAAMLADCVSQKTDLQQRVQLLEADENRLSSVVQALRSDVKNLKMQLMTTREQLTASHSREIADMKEQQVHLVSQMQSKLIKDRADVERKLRAHLQEKQRESEVYQAKATELEEKHFKLDLSHKRVQ